MHADQERFSHKNPQFSKFVIPAKAGIQQHNAGHVYPQITQIYADEKKFKTRLVFSLRSSADKEIVLFFAAERLPERVVQKIARRVRIHNTEIAGGVE